MRVNTWLALAVALLLSSLLASCGGASPPPQAQPATADAAAQGGDNGAYPEPAAPLGSYPAPSVADSAYPAPSPLPTPEGRPPDPIPSPAAGMGVVYGKVYSQKTDQPIYNDVVVYLSSVISTDSETMEAVASNEQEDVNVTPDGQGGFVFANVPPGRYGVVVNVLLSKSLARYAEDTSKEVVFSVEAGQALDLGKIYAATP